jgi:hypothetical protein
MIILVEYYYRCNESNCGWEWSKIYKNKTDGKYIVDCPICSEEDCYENNVAITKIENNVTINVNMETKNGFVKIKL